MNLNVAIIGAGPAGIACAIQLKRYGISPVIFEKNDVGGLLRNANFLENYPGFPKGIPGIELINKFKEHLKNLNISPIFEEATKVKFKNNLYELQTQNAVYTSKFLVVASGTRPKRLKRQSENLFYEVYDLLKHDLSDKKIAIIGSGDAAFDYALNIASNSRAKKISIFNRTSKTKCLPILKQRALENNRIKYLENCELTEDNEYDYILAAIGREANIDFIEIQELSEENNTFSLIGDVKNGDFRQATIAVGDGIRAAMEIYKTFSS